MDDLISRQTAQRLFGKALTYKERIGKLTWTTSEVKQWIADCIEQLPPARPAQRTGKWIKTARWGRVYYCNQCRNYLDFDGVNAGRGSTNYCPNCGCRMDGGE